MSLSSTVSRSDNTGNGSANTYSYGFKIFNQSDLLVKVRNPITLLDTTLVITTDYTVTGVGASGGGTIVLVNASQAWLTGANLTTGWHISQRRVPSLVQQTDIRNQGDYFPEDIEDQFDKDVMIAQELYDGVSKAAKLPETYLTSDFDPTLPGTLIGALSTSFGTNAGGDGFAVGPTFGQIADAADFADDAADSAAAALASQNAAAVSAAAALVSQLAAAVSAAAALLTVKIVTGNSGAPVAVVAGTALPVATSADYKKYIQGSGGAVIVSANPQIAPGSRDGQELLLVGCSDTNTVEYQHGNGLDLDGPVTLGLNWALLLNWDATAAIWLGVSVREN